LKPALKRSNPINIIASFDIAILRAEREAVDFVAQALLPSLTGTDRSVLCHIVRNPAKQ
jgi:hypothetical protein